MPSKTFQVKRYLSEYVRNQGRRQKERGVPNGAELNEKPGLISVNHVSLNQDVYARSSDRRPAFDSTFRRMLLV